MGALESTFQDLNFLLIGKTGNGKSSTANSILRKNVFKISTSMTACTKDVGLYSFVGEKRKINLVDTPGLADTVNDVIEDAKFARRNMTKAFQYVNYFHAVLLFLRYKDKIYSKEDARVIYMIKAIFGTDVVRKHCIIVVTHGDDFSKDAENILDLTFTGWCDQQQGELRALFQECQSRIVLFNNKGTEEDKEKSLSQILEFSKVIKAQGNIYSIKDYIYNVHNRNKLILTVFLSELKNMFSEKLQRMSSDLDLILSGEETILKRCKSILGEYSNESEFLSSAYGKIKQYVVLKEETPLNSDKINSSYAELKSVLRKPLLKDLTDLCLQFSKMEAPMVLVAELRDRTDLLLKQVRAEAQGTSLLDSVEAEVLKFQKKLSESVHHW